MNLTLLFDTVSEELYEPVKGLDTLANSISIHKAELPKWNKQHIALIGLTEERGSYDNLGSSLGADAIRKHLYLLKKGAGAYRIIDLGNLRNGPSLIDTYERLGRVCEMLLQENVLPLILGASHDLDIGQYMGYESQEQLITVLNIDSVIDMLEFGENKNNQTHIQELLSRKPNYLFSYNHLAYQAGINAQETLDILAQLYFDAYSVGQMREDFREVEPVVRQADMLSFDISAICMTDAPGNSQAPILGLNAEEACQICWFAGLSEKLSSIGFYEYNPKYDERDRTARLVALMVWYFIEGFYHRIKSDDFQSNAYMKYMVSALDHGSQMVFYKHKVSQKWWMEVPYPSEIHAKAQTIIVPCSYKDYQIASKGEVPNRWISTYAKLI